MGDTGFQLIPSVNASILMGLMMHRECHLWRFFFAVFTIVLMDRLGFASTATCHATFAAETGKPSGWLGGDAAYSIPLPDGRDVWIFGDTLYGPHRIVNGNDPQMVHNSIGISTCVDGQWEIRYFIRHDKAGRPTSFFSPGDATHWYWALDGFYANGDLWITLLCLHTLARPAAFGMNFETLRHHNRARWVRVPLCTLRERHSPAPRDAHPDFEPARASGSP
jgi:hypothetical protein